MNDDIDHDVSKENAEEILSTSELRRITELNKRAEAAYNKNNFRWAAELYWEIYRMERSSHVEFLKKMMLSSMAHKSLASNVFVFSVSSFLGNLALYAKSFKLKDTEDTKEEYFEVFESILKNEPDSAYAIKALSKSYEKNGFLNHSAMLLEFLTRKRKNDVPLLRKLADAYMEINEPEKARNVFKKILKIRPFDQDCEKKLRDIMAITSIDENKLKDGGGYRDNIKDKDYQYLTQLEMKMNRTHEEIDYLIKAKQNQINSKPGNISLRYDLLRYFKEKNDKEKIVDVLKEIADMTIGDLNVLLEKAEAETQLFLERSEKRRQAGEDEATLHKEMLLLKKKSFEGIAKQFSSNLDIKYKLAEVLFNLSELDDALKLFQGCSRVSDLSPKSKNYMGKIFIKKQMLDMAEDQYKSAISEVVDMNELKKELIYNLGIVYEKQKKNSEALEQFKIIYTEDVAYKDVSKKIEDSYKS